MSLWISKRAVSLKVLLFLNLSRKQTKQAHASGADNSNKRKKRYCSICQLEESFHTPSPTYTRLHVVLQSVLRRVIRGPVKSKPCRFILRWHTHAHWAKYLSPDLVCLPLVSVWKVLRAWGHTQRHQIKGQPGRHNPGALLFLFYSPLHWLHVLNPSFLSAPFSFPSSLYSACQPQTSCSPPPSLHTHMLAHTHTDRLFLN